MKLILFLSTIVTLFVFTNLQAQSVKDLQDLYLKASKKKEQFIKDCQDLTSSPQFDTYSREDQTKIYALLSKAFIPSDKTLYEAYALKADSLYHVNDLLNINIKYDIAICLMQKNKYEESLALFDHITNLMKRKDFQDRKDLDHPFLDFTTIYWGILLIKGVIYRQKGDNKKAISLLETSIPQLKEETELQKKFLYNYANLLSLEGRDVEALEVRRKLVLMYDETEEQSMVYRLKLNIATSLGIRKEYRKSIELVDEYLAAYKNKIVRYPSTAYWVKLDALGNLNRIAEAKTCFKEGLQVYKAINDNRGISYLYLHYLDLFNNKEEQASFFSLADSTNFYFAKIGDKKGQASLTSKILSFKIKHLNINRQDVQALDSLLTYADKNEISQFTLFLQKLKRDALVKLGKIEGLSETHSLIDSLTISLNEKQTLNHSSYIDNINKELQIKELEIAKQQEKQRTVFIILIAIVILVIVSAFLISRNLNQKRKAAIREKQLKEQLIVYYKSVSHDIKFPLNALKNKLSKIDSAENMVLVDNVRHTVEKLVQLFEIEDVEMERQSIILQDSIKRVANQLSAASKIQMNLTAKDILVADPFLFQQIILNVLHNALSYIDPNDGEIQINYQTQNNYHQIIISDNGPGMATSVTKPELLFDLNYSTREKDASKRGMGLFIVKKIIEKHGGFAKIDNTSKRGSGFEIQLNFPFA